MIGTAGGSLLGGKSLAAGATCALDAAPLCECCMSASSSICQVAGARGARKVIVSADRGCLRHAAHEGD